MYSLVRLSGLWRLEVLLHLISLSAKAVAWMQETQPLVITLTIDSIIETLVPRAVRAANTEHQAKSLAMSSSLPSKSLSQQVLSAFCSDEYDHFNRKAKKSFAKLF
jgi:hypothetical protein